MVHQYNQLFKITREVNNAVTNGQKRSKIHLWLIYIQLYSVGTCMKTTTIPHSQNSGKVFKVVQRRNE